MFPTFQSTSQSVLGGGQGTVTSVGLDLPNIFTSGSPVTTSGNISVTLSNQPGNTVFASPANGSTGSPSFRALVAADIPNISTDLLTSGILSISRGGTSSGNANNARMNLGAASAGPNSDITSMSAVVNITSPSNLILAATGNISVSSNLIFSSDLTYTIGGSSSGRPLTVSMGVASINGNINAEGNNLTILGTAGGSSFNLLKLGGTTASFPAIKRSGANLLFRNANDSADAGITAGNITATGTFSGNGSNITDITPANITSGNLPISSFNGGTNASADTVWTGNGTWTTVGLGHPISGTMSIVAGSSAGPGASAFFINGTQNDNRGQITLNTGSSTNTTSSLLTVTFATAYTNAPAVILTPTNAITANHMQRWYVSSANNLFIIYAANTALSTGTAYSWYYHVLGT